MERRTRAEWMGLLTGELSGSAAERLREAIRHDPGLEAELRLLEERWQSLELPPPVPAPAGFSTRIMARARERAETNAAPHWWRRTLAGRLATAAVFAGGVALGALLAAPSDSEQWGGHLGSEPSWAEDYLVEMEALSPDFWSEDDS